MSLENDLSLLCKNIVDNIRDMSNEFDIKTLTIMCNGPQRNEFGIPFTKILNSQDLLLSLLRLPKCIHFLKDDPDLSAEILSTLLKFSNKPWNLISTLISIIAESDYNKKEDAYQSLLSVRDQLPTKVAEKLITIHPKLLENFLLGIYKGNNNLKNNIWNERENECFIVWSCECSKIFMTIVSILNQFIIVGKSKAVILVLIKDYISSVLNECIKRNQSFIHLYPTQLQTLVSLLMLEPELNPCKDKARRQLKAFEMERPELALLFYTHFPCWLDESAMDSFPLLDSPQLL